MVLTSFFLPFKKFWELTVVLHFYDGNLQSYRTTTKLWELTVVLDYYEAKETYSRIEIPSTSIFLVVFAFNMKGKIVIVNPLFTSTDFTVITKSHSKRV